MIILNTVNIYAYVLPIKLPENHSDNYLLFRTNYTQSSSNRWVYIDMPSYADDKKIVYDAQNGTMSINVQLDCYYYDYYDSNWTFAYYSDSLYVDSLDIYSIFCTMNIYDTADVIICQPRLFTESDYTIFNKKLKYYNVTETLLLFIFILLFLNLIKSLFYAKGGFVR